MALTVNLVDYSPLYNALGAKKNAGLLAAQGSANNAQLVSGLTGLVEDAAKTVYGIMQQGALEKAKAATIALETEYSKRIAQGIYTGTISYDANGNLVMPQDLEDWYNGQQTDIEKSVENYPDIKNWASGQIAQVRQNGTLHALDVAGAAAKANRDANGKQVLSGALDQSVAQGKLDPFNAALAGQSWRSPEERALLGQLAEQDFNYRTKEGGIRNLVSAQGYDAGASQVETWRTSGQVTGDQADQLLTAASNQFKVQGTVLAQQAQASFTQMTGAGVDSEMAIRLATKNLPEAYKGQTDELLTAAAETAATRADSKADEDMQGFYGKNRDDPAGMRAYLDLPKNDFSRLMKRDTYMYWSSVTQALLEAQAGGGGGGAAAMTPGERVAWGMFYDPVETDTMVGKGIQQLVVNGTLGPDIAPQILAKMSERQTFLNPVVLSGVNVINSTFDIMAEKEKDPQKNATIRAVQRDALMNLDKYLGGGPHTEAQISGAVDAFLKPYKADLLKADWWNPATKTDVDVIRSQVQQGRYLPPDQTAAFERYDRDMLGSAYGVGTKPGTVIQASEQMDNGMTRFAIVGLSPKNPKATAWYTFQTDPSTGTEQLMVLEDVKNTKGETIDQQWTPATFVKTLAQEKQTAEVTTRAKRAAEAQSQAATVRAAFQAGPFSKLTVVQSQQLVDSLNAPNPTRKYIEMVAADLSKAWGVAITVDQLMAEASRRGIWVKP